MTEQILQLLKLILAFLWQLLVIVFKILYWILCQIWQAYNSVGTKATNGNILTWYIGTIVIIYLFSNLALTSFQKTEAGKFITAQAKTIMSLNTRVQTEIEPLKQNQDKLRALYDSLDLPVSVPQATASTGLATTNPNDYVGKAIKSSSLGLPDLNTLDCVDVFNIDFWSRTGINPKIKAGSALQIWNTPELEIDDSIEFVKIANTKSFVPQAGDYAFWTGYPSSENPEFQTKNSKDKKISGKSPYGHVAIITSATSTTLNVIEQDTFANKPAYKAERNYEGFAGVIRLVSKKAKAQTQQPIVAVVTDNGFNRASHQCIFNDQALPSDIKSETAEIVIKFFKSNKFSCKASVYMTASLIVESRLDSMKKEKCGWGFCGQSRGLAQWRASRLDDLRKKCNPEGDFNCQLDFIIIELQNKESKCNNFETNDVAVIKQSIQCYERYGVPGDRYNLAEKMLSL